MAAIRPRSVVTSGLLALNGLAFLFELSLGGQLEPFMRRWGTVPQDVRAYFLGQDPSPAALVTILTALFLHADWLHLVANMLYLWVFGARLERALGGPGFLALYLATGIVAGIGQILAGPNLPVPAVGASGAVAGLLGAYLALHSRATLAALAPRFFYYGRAVDVLAAALLALWLASQLVIGALTLVESGQGQAANWWAHLAGFGAGLLLGSLAGRWRGWVGAPEVGAPAA